jgi:hypothetical protein
MRKMMLSAKQCEKLNAELVLGTGEVAEKTGGLGEKETKGYGPSGAGVGSCIEGRGLVEVGAVQCSWITALNGLTTYPNVFLT